MDSNDQQTGEKIMNRKTIIKKWHCEDMQEFMPPAGSYSATLYQERSWLDELLPCEQLSSDDLAFMYRYGN